MSENGEILRSINNNHRSFVRFVNNTPRNVVLYWIDYQGQAVSYGTLSKGDYIDINTFVTHPWIFGDEETTDRYTVNQRYVFFPEPWFARYRGMRRNQLPERVERTVVYITLPIYTLRELCLRAIKRRLKDSIQVFALEIPRSLQYELGLMLMELEGRGSRTGGAALG